MSAQQNEIERLQISMAGKRVLVVGAGGFVGGYFIELGLKLGCEVWAGVRKSTKRDRFTDPRIKFIEFDYDNQSEICRSMRDELGQDGKWDYIIYNLGATQVRSYADFNRINYEYLKAFTGALHSENKIPEKLLYISSLSVMGPIVEKDRGALTEEMIPQPNTRYGASKLKAELWLATAGIPYIIFRCTGIYGPWDKDYFLMFKSIKKGFDFGVGFRRQTLTFIYAEDLALAAYMALEKAPVGEIYNISESKSYSQKEFRRLAMRRMRRKCVMPFKLPLWVVGPVCALIEMFGVLRGKSTTLNRDKFRILRQRNWACDTSKANRDFGFEAPTDLEKGIDRTLSWYENMKWL